MAKAAAKSCVIRGVHLTFILCVIIITRSKVVGSEFRLSDNLFLPSSSFDDLAQEVCSEIGENPPECIKQFLGPPEAAWLPSELQVTERQNGMVMYNATPSDMLQLVVLVPDEGYIIRKYVSPYDIPEPVRVNDTKYYTFWTTVLAFNGTHSAWREGPKLGPLIPLEQKEYDILIDENYDNSSYVRVNFKWSATGDFDDVLQKDTSYKVANGCINKPDTEDLTKIKAGKAPTHAIDVSPGDKCTFTVSGPDGQGELQYKVGPQPIENITVVASPSKEAWDVRVRWERPPRDPEEYRIVLQGTNFTASLNQSGNATLATFHKVTGQGYYNVSLDARFGSIKAHSAGPLVYIPRNY